MSETVVKAKLQMKDLGPPKGVFKLSEEGDTDTAFLLGTCIGIASGIKNGIAPDAKPYTGLKGTFEGVPADPKRDTVRSGVCYLPSGFQEPIEAALADGNATVRFAFEVYTVRSSAPIGYSYKLKQLSAPSAVDPLSEFRSEIPALAPPKATNGQAATPEGDQAATGEPKSEAPASEAPAEKSRGKRR